MTHVGVRNIPLVIAKVSRVCMPIQIGGDVHPNKKAQIKGRCNCDAVTHRNEEKKKLERR